MGINNLDELHSRVVVGVLTLLAVLFIYHFVIPDRYIAKDWLAPIFQVCCVVIPLLAAFLCRLRRKEIKCLKQ